MQALRDQSFAELRGERDWWDTDPNALEVRGSLQGQMRGQDVPFTELVQQGLIGRDSDANASALAQQQELIRQQMASAGLSGGGGQLAAQLSAQRAASAAQRSAARDIRTRAELENFQARERARQEVSQLMAREAAQRMQATNKAVDLRSQMEIIRSNEQNVGTFAQALAAMNQGGGSSAQGYQPIGALPTGYQGRVTGNPVTQSSYGGVTYLPSGVSVQPFRQTTAVQRPQFGLGGANGPWDEIADAHATASRNMQRNAHLPYSSSKKSSLDSSIDDALDANLSMWQRLKAGGYDEGSEWDQSFLSGYNAGNRGGAPQLGTDSIANAIGDSLMPRSPGTPGVNGSISGVMDGWSMINGLGKSSGYPNAPSFNPGSGLDFFGGQRSYYPFKPDSYNPADGLGMFGAPAQRIGNEAPSSGYGGGSGLDFFGSPGFTPAPSFNPGSGLDFFGSQQSYYPFKPNSYGGGGSGLDLFGSADQGLRDYWKNQGGTFGMNQYRAVNPVNPYSRDAWLAQSGR